MKEFKKTLTHSFLMPLLLDYIPIIYERNYLENPIKNCFLYDSSVPKYKYSIEEGIINNAHLTLVLQLNKTFRDVQWMTRIKDFPHYIDHYYIDNSLIAVVVKFPEEYLVEFRYFLDGKYSRFSDKAKETIANFYKGVKSKKFVTQTLYKSMSLRNSWKEEFSIEIPFQEEYWYKPSLEYKPDIIFSTGEVLTPQIKEILIRNERGES